MTTTTRGAVIDLVDTAEIAGALRFVADWLTTDRDRLAQSLAAFATDHYSIDDLHDDLIGLADLVTQARVAAVNQIGGTP